MRGRFNEFLPFDAQTRGTAPSPGRDRVFLIAVSPSPRKRGEESRVPASRTGLGRIGKAIRRYGSSDAT
jgi:hypothetical protein